MEEKNIILIKARYMISVLLAEGSKLFLSFIIFTIMNKQWEFLLSLFFLVGIRTNLGGFHFSKHIICLLYTIMYFAIVIFIGKILVVSNCLFLLISIILAVLIQLEAPLPGKEVPHFTSKQRRRFKRRGTIAVIIFFLTGYLFQRTQGVIIMGMLMQIIETIIFITRRSRDEKEKGNTNDISRNG